VAEVAWRPGADNNDQIIDYIVYYNITLFDGEQDPPASGTIARYREGPRTNRNQLLARVRLVPGASYSFHVRASNSVGISDRSATTKMPCRTPPTVPFRNPNGVCTESIQSNQLAIVWQVSVIYCLEFFMFFCFFSGIQFFNIQKSRQKSSVSENRYVCLCDAVLDISILFKR
jgi:hypothetical protein